MGGKVLEYDAKTIFQKGISEGKTAGIQEGRIESYVELIKDGILTLADAANRLDMSEEELINYL